MLFAISAICEAEQSGNETITAMQCNYYELAKYAFDYRNITGHNGHNGWLIRDIFRAHIKPAIEAMYTRNGQGIGGSASGNLDYALKRIPNDPRSLKAIIDYYFIIKTKPRHSHLVRAPECYLKKAMMFVPGDPVPIFLYGYYMFKKNRYKLAIKWYKRGLEKEPESSEGNYNLGLLYFNIKQYNYAKHYAEIAYKLGFPLPGLKNKLKMKGYPID